MSEEFVNVRYMVDDVDAAVEWYIKHLGFSLLTNRAPAFADIKRGSLRLLLSGATSSAGRAMPHGEQPRPCGWNRIHFIVDDLPAETARLRAADTSIPVRLLGLNEGWLAIAMTSPVLASSTTIVPPSALW